MKVDALQFGLLLSKELYFSQERLYKSYSTKYALHRPIMFFVQIFPVQTSSQIKQI